MRFKNLQKHLSSLFDGMKREGTFKRERIITSAQSNLINTTTNSSVLNFCSNNYLGLCDNKEIADEAIRVIKDRGFGLSSVRFICGTTDYHKTLEQRISEFYETEDTILFPSCFDANEAIFESFLTEEDAVISDSLNHASIINGIYLIQGIRLCKAERLRYSNNNMEELENCLKSVPNKRFKLIVTDSVFSMDGEVANLQKINELADKYNAIIMIDECHGTGVLGEKGRGAIEATNSLGKIGIKQIQEIISSTLGKALGGANGGFITGKKEIVELLRQKGRPYLFSNSLPTHIVAAYIKALDILEGSPQLMNQLHSNVKLFREKMKNLGFEIMGNPQSAIVPVLLRDAKVTSEFADALLKEGIYVIGFSYPVVGKNLARIRVQLSACHSEENVLKCVEAFEKVGKQKNII